ncbi:MAG TPA: hypothetical protein VGO40_24610 [Longimicrobium sp.]|jgi:hypothetical protein|nr:hypothetical protein [Longimicrobium sp.]
MNPPRLPGSSLAKPRWGRVVRVCAAAAAIAACAGDEKPGPPAPPSTQVHPRADPAVVYGRWRGPHDELELFRNGRLLLHQGAYRVAGSYEFVEPGRVLLIYQNALAAVPPGDYRVAVTADSLTFCEADAPARCIGYARMAPRDSAAVANGADSAARLLAALDGGAPPRLAAPIRPDQYPPESRAREADGVLKQAYVLQQSYKAQYGHYAAELDSLRQVGWEMVPLRYFRQPRIRASGERLCIVVQPRTADLWPMHIDEQGRLGRGASCR